MIAWFWFSGFPSPSFGFPGNFMEYISYKMRKANIEKGHQKNNVKSIRGQTGRSF